MGLYKIIKTEEFEIGIWKITESLNELVQIAKKISLPLYKSEKKKKEFLIKHLLINKIAPKNKLKYNKSGAPILNRNKYISISHTNKLVAINSTLIFFEQKNSLFAINFSKSQFN